MIRAGRDVVDIHGIAEVSDQAYATVSKYTPWRDPRHPQPVNALLLGDSMRGRFQRRPLFDRKQIEVYYNGKGRPIPAIPDIDHDRDLLDIADSASALSLSIPQVKRLVENGRMAAADETRFGIPHWYRRTVRETKSRIRATPDRHRPSADEREQIRRRLVDALDRARRPDGSINVAALAREAGVARLTASRFVQDLPQ